MSLLSRRRPPLRRSDDAVFFGVCGGIAEHFDLSPWGVRLFFLLLQCTVAPYLFIAYIVLGLVLKKPGARPARPQSEREFENAYETSRSLALEKVRAAFDRLDERIRRMESVVTRPGFDLDDKYRDL